MDSIFSLLSWIGFGDFGLFTLCPRYLFGVLFPVMVFLGFLSAFLAKVPFFRGNGPGISQFFYILAGLGCTTAALAASDSIKDRTSRRRICWLLVLLIPCSSQIAIILAFSAMASLRVFLTYLFFVVCFSALLYGLLAKLYPLKNTLTMIPDSAGFVRPLRIIRDAFWSVASTIPSFSLGSAIISMLQYSGALDALNKIAEPWLQGFLHLPKEAAGLFVLNLFKRDFGASSLLMYAEGGAFDAMQMVVVMVMLTFCVPCFNSTVFLFKQEKLPMAISIWLGSLFISCLFGRLVSTIFFVCAL